MGKINDGTVTGFIPTTEAFAVHYPGYPSSMSRAVQTLGGTEAILQARSSQSNKLELHFRPEDPYSHPSFGDVNQCSGLLLKIHKGRASNDQNADASESMSPDETISGDVALKNQPENEYADVTRKVEKSISEEGQLSIFADIVAQIPEAYHFNGMVDYQHVVAVHANVAQRKKRNWTELKEPCTEKGSLMDVDQENVMILVPSLFALKDMPENLVLKTPAIVSSKKKQDGDVQRNWEADKEQVLAIDFNIKEIPKIVNWEDHIPRGSEQWVSQMVVTKLFEERPIWPKDSLLERLLDKGLIFGQDMFRRHLSRVAYYFSNGPFLRFWIKKGYDPRKDPDSRIYQRIDFRVPHSLRSYCDANEANKSKHRREDICAFRVFPNKLQTSLQLFELADDYIQEEIRKPSTETTCSYGRGWFSQRMLNCLRQRVMVRFLSVFPKAGAETLLRAASENFEKLKRENRKDTLKLDEEEDQQTKTEIAENEDKEEFGCVEDNEEDDIDIDNDEEALDTYEALDTADEDVEIYLQSQSYGNMENFSKSHLQDLFRSFPSITEAEAEVDAEKGDKVQDADTSDEEYQIYEQDDNDDNDD